MSGNAGAPRMRWCVLAILVAGCTGVDGPGDTTTPHSGMSTQATDPVEAPQGIWMTQSIGCGFCWLSTGPHASALIVYDAGGPLWISYGPGNATNTSAVPPGLEAAVEQALAHLHDAGAYHARHEVQAYDVVLGDWDDRSRSDFQASVAPHLDSLGPPPRHDNDCTDYGFPHVSIVTADGLLAGEAPEPGDECSATDTHGPWNHISAALGREHRALRR